MSKISKAAGLPMGTIYTMFASKDELINATYVFCRENYMGKIRFPQIDSDTNWESAIKKAIFAYMESAISHDRDFMFVEQCYLNPIIRPELISDGAALLGNVSIADIIQHNSPQKRPTYLIQHLLLAVIHKSINLYLTGHIFLDCEIKDEIARICWDILTA